MFILSKRNFKVRRADGSSFLIKKDFIGDIPEDVFNSRLIQKAIKGGLVAAPESHKDKALYEADTEAADKADAVDIRPDAKNKEKTEEDKKTLKK
mgnify:FL=1